MRIVCPQCGESYELDDEYESVEVQCENCGRQFIAKRDESILNKRCSYDTKKFEHRCLVEWLVLLGGVFVGWLISLVLSLVAFLPAILFAGSDCKSVVAGIVSVIAIILGWIVRLMCPAIGLYLAYRFIVVKMVSKRLTKEECRV